MPSVRVALVSLALLAACSNPNTAALEALIEVKLELRAGIDELRQARIDLEAARQELERARNDTDKARRAFSRATEPDAPIPDIPPFEPLAPEIAAAILCPVEGQCTIQRAALDKIFADPATLSRQARIVPSIKEGVELGFKMYGIRPGSLPKLFGFKNGDLVSAINDKPVTSLDAVMVAIKDLRSASTLKFVGERKGAPLEMVVKIVD